MSAPIDNASLNLSKFALNTLTLGNLSCSLVLLCITVLPLNSYTMLDIINKCFTATKLLILFVFLHNIFLWFRLSRHSRASAHKLKMGNVVKGTWLYFAGSMLFYIIAVLFGAPFTESTGETFHFAALLSSTTVLPILFTLGMNSEMWVRVFALSSPDLGPESVVYITTISSITCAWLGAFPIPLDWDRPWQVWPITCVMGTIIGYILGLLVSTVHLHYQYNRVRKLKLR